MPPKPLAVCCHCGEPFRPDRFNHHHQAWCSRPECRAARDRERRGRYRQRCLSHDGSFRERERIRCREAMRKWRHGKRKTPSRPPPPAVSSGGTEDTVFGVIAQLIGSTDYEEVRQAASIYADRGRRLSVLSRYGGDTS